MNTQRQTMEKINAELQTLRAEVQKLRAQAEKGNDGERARFDRYIDTLEEKGEEVSEHLKNLKGSGDQAMEDIMVGLKEAWDRLDIAKEAAKARFH